MMQQNRHTVYNINYHLVWCPKYRKPVLVGKVKDVVNETIREQCTKRGWTIHELSIQPDHVHVFVSVPPHFSPMFVVKVFKGSTAVRCVKIHRFAERFWSPSYYVGTAGNMSAATIQKYIQAQEGSRDSPPS